ncbi:hypothetical protein [Pontibacter lucknowensis]|uniref:Uncharacterized protein n=1 Tax=Pontibacter lucknowensis TaxID=1077936 RepID=A0A1N6YLM7_9BACT|nr:hypothetical protein [Pontibacter lucknowensis]SIR15371.1 hypothetical protein SAMN05421545_2570 [Pontibacter lucknowensis]
MKNIAILVVFTFLPVLAFSQDFSKSLAEAKTSYTSGDLSSSRFAMEQMLRSLDAEIGKEILKMLPAKMEDRNPNVKEDDVTGGGAGLGMGLFVHRSYGPATNQVTIDIINNSPLINSLQAVLALPFIGNSGDGKQKVVKVHGYKAVLNKVEGMEGAPAGYELQIPLQNTLLTLKADNTKEDNILKMANSLPLDKIAQMAH